MKPETAQFLATVARLFWDDPSLEAWYGIDRHEFLLLITQLTSREDIEEAITVLEEIADGRFSPTVPPNIKELVEDLERLENQIREEPQARDESKVLAAQAIARWQRLLSQDRFEALVPPKNTEESPQSSPRESAVVSQRSPTPPPTSPEKPITRKTAQEREERVIRLGTTAISTSQPGQRAQAQTAQQSVATLTTPQTPKQTTILSAVPTTPTRPIKSQTTVSGQENIERVLLAISKPPQPVLNAVGHFVATLPAKGIKLTLDLGREALAKTNPNVENFVLIWRDGITSRAIKAALRSTSSRGISQKATEVLAKQADILESYEKSHPVLTKLFTTLHRSSSLTVGVHPIETLEQVTESGVKRILALDIDKTKEIITFSKNFSTSSISNIQSWISQNPPTAILNRTAQASSPAIKTFTANVLTRMRILAIKGPYEIGQAVFFPGTGRGSDQASAITSGGGPIFAVLSKGLLGKFVGLIGPALRAVFGFLGPALRVGLSLLGAAIKFGVGILGGAGALGGALGGLGAIGGALSGLATAGAGLLAGSVGLTVLTVGAVFGAPIILTLININTNSRAYLGTERAASGESPYISVSKTASETTFKNEDMPKSVSFRLSVAGKQGPLKNVRIVDAFTITGTGQATLSPKTWTVDEINSPWNELLTVTLPDTLEDNLVINSLTIVAEVEGVPEEQKRTVSVALTIGNPPQDCPSGWPTEHGYINQGPNGTVSHQGLEAIDIHGNPRGTDVRATSGGLVYPFIDAYGGKAIEIAGTCNGKPFSSYYSHFLSIDPSVAAGKEIKKGDILGTVDCTGNCLSDHVHYHFGWRNDFHLKMGPPYIPVAIPEGCVGPQACGDIKW